MIVPAARTRHRPRPARRASARLVPRRALAMAGLALVTAGVLTLPGVAHPGRAAAATQCPGTTVTGPHLWDPTTNKPLASASTVTVDQTGSLVNQMVQVCWSNFTPSQNGPYQAHGTLYPVMIAECAGTNPTTPADCYGAELGGVTSNSGPAGPPNTAYADTAPDGTGQSDMLIYTGLENTSLGCDQSHPCSLAIVPAQGGAVLSSPVNCKDHSEDAFLAQGYIDFNSSANEYSCSWADRIVVPLTFAAAPNTCPFQNAVFTAAGSPMLARAMNSWVAGLCAGSHGLPIQYNSAVAEPLAVQEAAGGLTDIALTTRPASAQGLTPTRHYLYAPVAVSAVSVAYWVDDPTSGQPVTDLKLNQQLLLKLLTQSYDFQNEGAPCSVPPPPAGFGCDNGVDHNPLNLFADPEFQQLNPAVQPVIGLGSQFQVPTVQSGHSDMTWFVTRWIAADTNAKNFLAGQFDNWGMHLNTAYTGLQYPTDAFSAQDSYPVIAHRYNPVFPLAAAAALQSQNLDAGTSPEKDQTGNFPKDPVQPPGQRALFAVIDQGSSAAFRFPVAAIPNATGSYTQPTSASMAAALQGMQSDGSGTQQVNLASTNKAAYPLTMVIYAMVPTSGTPRAKAAAIARFLDYAAGAGQAQGVQPGQLPPGYLPMPASMRATTLKDATAVLHQTGATRTPKGPVPGAGPGSSPAPGSSTTRPGGKVTLPTVGPGAGGTGGHVSLVPLGHVQPASIMRFALPALLVLGGLAALAGSSSLAGASSTEILARLRWLRQTGVTRARAMRNRLGPRRST